MFFWFVLVLNAFPAILGDNNVFVAIEYKCITNSSSAIVFDESFDHLRSTVGPTHYISTFVPKISNLLNIDCDFLNENDDCLKEWKVNNWQFKNSLTGKIKNMVTDRRWEYFPIYLTVHELQQEFIKIANTEINNFQIPISLRAKYEAHVYLCDDDSPIYSNCYWLLIGGFKGENTVIRKCPTGQIKKSFTEWPKPPCKDILKFVNHTESERIIDENIWKHFTISIKGNEIKMMQGDREVIKYSDMTNNVYNVNNFIINTKRESGLWKLHLYNYIYTETELNEKLGPSFKIRNNIQNCISFYVIMCKHCQIKFELIASNGYTVYSKIFDTKLEEWKEVKLIFSTNKPEKTDMYVTTLNDFQNKKGFWAIGGVRECQVEEYRVINSRKPSQPCQMVSNENFIKTNPKYYDLGETLHHCNGNTFGQQCLPCEWFFGQQYCPAKQYCQLSQGNAKPNCYCTAGYRLESCLTICPAGQYGHNCEQLCINCLYKQCDNHGFCHSQCENGFSGDTCEIPAFPVFKYAPVIKRVGHTTCTVRLENFETIGTVQTSHLYQIQYKKQTQNWFDYGNAHQFNDQTEIEIKNLQTDTDYSIRAIIGSPGTRTIFGESIATNTCHTTCNVLKTSQIVVKPTNTTANISFVNLSQDDCKLDNYMITVINHTHVNSFNLLYNLEPFTKYTVQIKHTYTNMGVNYTFKTLEGVPGKVNDLTKEKTTEVDIELSWKEPTPKNGEITTYLVEYQFKYAKACFNGGIYFPTNEAVITIPAENTNIIIDNLKPYSCYEISVYAMTSLKGEEQKITMCTKETTFIVKDEYPMVKVDAKETTANITLEWMCKFITGPIKIDAEINCVNNWCNKPQKLLNNQVTFNSGFNLIQLLPYSNYSITLYLYRTVREDDKENKIIKTFNTLPTVPNEITDVQVTTKDTKSISFRWLPPNPPNGLLQNYLIVYDYNSIGYYPNKIKFLPSPCKLWPNYHCAKVSEELSKGYIHEFQISARNKIPDNYNSGVQIYAYALEEQPERPYNIHMVWSRNNENLTISWTHPNNTNGVLKKFIISIKNEDDTSYKIFDYKINSEDDYNITYTQIIPNPTKFLNFCNTYLVTVEAKNSLFSGVATLRKDFVPPPISKLDNQIDISSTNTTVTLNIAESSTKSKGNYQIHIIVGVSETDEKPNKHWEMLTTKLNDTLKMEPFRIVTESLSTKFPVIFDIGNNITITSKYFESNLTNPPLKTGTAYNISILVINNCRHKTSLSLIERNIHTKGPTVIIMSDGTNPVIYVIVALLILAILIAGFFVYRKKIPERMLRNILVNADTGVTNSMRSIEELPLTTSVEKNTPVIKPNIKPKIKLPINNVPKTEHSKLIKINELEAYIKNSITTRELERQHNLFPRGLTKPAEYGALAQNKPKNRYNNLIAYDHTRVKLAKINDKPYTDYINANYIDGYKTKKVYIATQGPKSATLFDFWRMIWQENVYNIVMLANVIENGKKKVEKYWPDINGELKFNDITIQFVSSDLFANFEYRVFNVTCENMQRKVNQLHFTSWPDHGVPLYPQSLVPFLQRLLTIPNNPKSPVVVHCSAGVGRTGTIILCDICLRMAAGEGRIDFLGNLEHLRSQRPNMVDNVEQYKLVHLVVLECLMGMKTAVKCNENMKANIAKMLNNASITSQMRYLIDTEWQDEAMKTVYGSDEELANYPEKCRFPEIVPEKQSQIFLSRYPATDNKSSYINAVIVDGFCSPGRFIATQQPLPATLGDFWRLVAEKNSTVVLSLNTIDSNDKTSCKFWPEEKCSITPVDYITITHTKTTSADCYSVITVQMCVNQDENDKTSIDIVALKNWPSNEILPQFSIENFLTFWEDSDGICRRSDPIIVTCYNGATACGLYIAMSFLIEKMKLEHECDVCQAVRNIRHNRKQFVSHQEQFEFLYKASVKYITGFQSYANFN